MTMTIKPAAGPLIVSSEFDRNMAVKPPMIAVKIPAIGEIWKRTMPRDNGSASGRPEILTERRTECME